MLMDISRADKNNKIIREVMFLEGFANAAAWVIPMFITLQFVTNNFEYGSFFSYLALVGAISAIVLGRKSDKTGKRAKYIAPIMMFNGIALVIAGLAGDFVTWSIALGANSFLTRLEWPFTWAMVTDVAKGIGDAMIAREFWLNAGRTTCLLIITAMMLLNIDMQLGLIVGGMGSLAFPLFMKKRRLG